MKKIELLCIGDLKFRGLIELEKNYLDKLKYFTDFSVRCLKEVKCKDEKQIKAKEAETFLRHVSSKDILICLDERGREFDSHGFSDFINKKVSYDSRKIVFLIGGHMGFDNSLLQRADHKISFSKMTFPHDLFRVFCLEQIYRAFTIIKGIRYHR